ncbi:hypothetical protein EKK58_12175 [Candidatus Dependentiae bacterium]|nr:MAG: hypothetical protein EKK58_12175 [Candidatus Dependentiae bacterium]
MAKKKLEFSNFGLELPPEEITDLIIDHFNEAFRGGVTIDELLLHPRDAMCFCDAIRMKNGWMGLPDDLILRAILNRRKKGSL